MCMKLLVILTLAVRLKLVQADEILLESLQNGPGILPFTLGPARVISHYHSFVHNLNLDNIRSKLEATQEQLANLTPQLHNKTSSLYLPHVKYLEGKLEEISELLKTFEAKRFKRGLIDGLGSVIKSVSGNLDYTDALKYDRVISELKQNQNNLAIEINHQMSLSKQWVSRSLNVTDRLVENQKRIEKIVNSILNSDVEHETNMIKYAHLAQLLLIVGDNVDNLAVEFSKLENLLEFIKAKSVHHSAINYETYRSMMSRLAILYDKNEILDISFRECFEIIKLGYYYKGNDIILVIKIPILRPTNYILYKLSFAPNHDSKILTPTYPYVAIHREDLLYMETECPKYSHGHLCEDNPSHHQGDQTTCIRELLLRQHIHETCHFTSVILTSEAMEQLDDLHYVLSFPNLTKIRITCSQDQSRTVKGSYLAVIPKGCELQTPAFTVRNEHDRVEGKILKIMDIAVNEEESYKVPVKKTIKLNTIDLSQLHSSNSEIAVQEPVSLKSSNIDVIYHTTIPVYILFGAAALITIVILRRNRNHQVNVDIPLEAFSKKEEEHPNPPKDETTSEKPAHPLSALFSTKVSK